MFPRGAPGVALVLLRVSVAVTLWTGGSPACAADARRWLLPAIVPVAIVLCMGLVTPVAAACCAVLSGVTLVCSANGQAVTLASLATALALALLGPGGYSVDAWMFGRRVVIVSPGKVRDTH
jgi:hypothetical protein